MPATLEQSAMRKIAWRVVPFLGFAYFANSLDRSNVAVAALTMNKSLGFTAAEYGLGAGAFFWSYVLFQVPSNMILSRVGARRWLAVVIVAWGLCSAATALVTGVKTFALVRFLLGVAEAGYLPGAVFFMTRWFPSRHRGRALGIFYAFAAAAVSAGAPIAGNILVLHGWLGLEGWQWIFLLEASPSLFLGAICLFLLRDDPKDAPWLTADEKAWLQQSLAREQSVAAGNAESPLRLLHDGKVILLTIAYLAIGFGVYANVFFLPLIIKDIGFSNLTVSYLAAVPAALGALGMVLVSRSSDRSGERIWHATVPVLLAAAGLITAGLFVGNPWVELIGLCVVGFGISSCLPCFWNLPTAYLSAGTAAAGIAIINSVGNLSGYLAPQLMGWLRDMTGSYRVGLLVVGGITLLAAVLLPFFGVGITEARRFSAKGAD
jgi:MFS transporter, ACS family, tartrate transporter